LRNCILSAQQYPQQQDIRDRGAGDDSDEEEEIAVSFNQNAKPFGRQSGRTAQAPPELQVQKDVQRDVV
jgi:hypothetical protein